MKTSENCVCFFLQYAPPAKKKRQKNRKKSDGQQIAREWKGTKIQTLSQLPVFCSRVTELTGVIVLGVLMMTGTIQNYGLT